MSLRSLFFTGRACLGSSIAIFFWVLLGPLFLPLSASAQQFEMTVSSDRQLPSRLSLAVFLNDSVPVLLSPSSSSAKECLFSGRLSSPVYAELRSSQLSAPLGLFVESATIQVHLDPSNPDKSKVTGSRSNSMYRYQLEQALEDTSNLGNYLRHHPDEVYDAALIVGSLSHISLSQAQTYAALLKGPARKGYPYRQLTKTLSSIATTSVGLPMPDFVFPNEKGTLVHYDSVRKDSLCSVILIGASWCDQCTRIEKELDNIQKANPSLHTLVVRLDKHKQGWNAPYIQQLAIDHIPYIILVDNQGIICARDLRIWQLERELSSLSRQSK